MEKRSFSIAGHRTSIALEPEFWRGLEQDRKKGRKLIGAFGPALLLGAALRLVDIHAFADRVARRFGLRGTVVAMSAVVIWKFIAKVPCTKTIASTSSTSGRRAT